MSAKNINFIQPPYVGRWISSCGSIKASVMKKPRWFHRKMMLLILGIDWEDIK
jgi:hypothetical protein